MDCGGRMKMNGDGRKCKVRKRGCSSSSSSSLSLVHNYRLKRAFLLGKRVGSTTPVPKWKMMASKSPSIEETEHLAGGEVPVSARKLAATLWEIDGGLPSPGLKRWDKKSGVEIVGKHSVLEASEKIDQPHRGRASQKLEVQCDQVQNHAHRQINRIRNRVKDVYNCLVTCKELFKVMSRIAEQNSTSLSLFSAVRLELDRACMNLGRLIHDQKTESNDIDNLLKRLEEERIVWKLTEEDRIQRAIETQRTLRKQAERRNKNLAREVESERQAREMLEKVCDELAREIGEGRAEVEEMKRRSEKVCQEVEKEREMLQLANVLREERVQMKLAQAKYEFEEKNEVVDKLRRELEAYLKTKKGEELGGGSPSYDKIKELEKYLRETLPSSYDHDHDNDDDDDSSRDSDLHSIELNVEDLRWMTGSKMNKQEPLDEFAKREVEEGEMERYNIIKHLRDHIVSGSVVVSPQKLAQDDSWDGL